MAPVILHADHLLSMNDANQIISNGAVLVICGPKRLSMAG